MFEFQQQQESQGSSVHPRPMRSQNAKFSYIKRWNLFGLRHYVTFYVTFGHYVTLPHVKCGFSRIIKTCKLRKNVFYEM